MTTYIIASKCELSLDRWRKLKKKSNASICYTRRENTESNFSTAGTCLRMTRKAGQLLDEIRKFVKPHFNELIAM